MRNIVDTGNGTVPIDSGLPHVSRFLGLDDAGDPRSFPDLGSGAKHPMGVFAVDQEGRLRGTGTTGGGDPDPTGTLGWDPRSSTQIGRGC
jgi:hypothetical protein